MALLKVDLENYSIEELEKFKQEVDSVLSQRKSKADDILVLPKFKDLHARLESYYNDLSKFQLTLQVVETGTSIPIEVSVYGDLEIVIDDPSNWEIEDFIEKEFKSSSDFLRFKKEKEEELKKINKDLSEFAHDHDLDIEKLKVLLP